MFSKAILIIIVFVVFVFGYLIGSGDTKECVGLGFASQGRYTIVSGGQEGGAWILDTQEGHLWRGFSPDRAVIYIGQAK